MALPDATDALLKDLAAAAPAWKASSKAERAALAQQVLARLGRDEWSTAGEWVPAELKLMKIAPGDAAGAFAAGATRFVFGSSISDWLRTFIKSCEAGAALPQMPDAPDGSRKYGPISLGAGAPGSTAELWASAELGEVSPTPAAGTAASAAPCGVTLTLGAGNQSFLTMVDALERCLVHAETVLIKHHPLRSFLLAPFSQILEPLMHRGAIAQIAAADCGVAAVQALLRDDRVGHVHLTGSEATAKAIRGELDGSGRSHVQLSAELGCVTPWIVAPGEWSAAELAHAAQLLAVAKKSNGGSNCLSPQVLVLPRDWAQKSAFLEALEKQLQMQPTVPAYYPGARERREALATRYGERARSVVAAQRLQPAGPEGHSAHDEALLLECGVAGEPGFEPHAIEAEVFCPALALVELPGGESAETGAAAESYLIYRAVPFANEQCTGSLSCTLLAPGSLSAVARERAVAALTYGTVCVNAWSVYGYMAACRGAVWGAHPFGDGRSGEGQLGNAFGVSRANKGVVRGPPLSSAPAMDNAKPPPALILDALHAVLNAPSLGRGFARLWLLLSARAAQHALWTVGIGGSQRRYGASA